MQGVGVPLVTPFTETGEVDEVALTDLVGELEARGIDFLVPVGSTGESVLLTDDERARVIRTVVDAATVPVLAGTGHPGLRATQAATVRAASAGADAALVVTPYYYRHDQATLTAYYRALADDADLPIYLYSIPSKTDVALEPETAETLAAHPNIAGLKDSSGDLERLHREVARTDDAAFEVLVGHGGLFAHALEIGATGGILALANVAPERSTAVYERFAAGDASGARSINRELVELNRAITTAHGVPGVKAAMRLRGLPAGHVRSPHRPVDDDVVAQLESLVEAAGP